MMGEMKNEFAAVSEIIDLFVEMAANS